MSPAPLRNAASTAGSSVKEANVLRSIYRWLPIAPLDSDEKQGVSGESTEYKSNKSSYFVK